MLRRNLALPAAIIIAVAAGCASEVNGNNLDSDAKAASKKKAAGGSVADGDEETGEGFANIPSKANGTTGKTHAALPNLTPASGRVLSSPREVLRGVPFSAPQPAVRANDMHSFSVTGKDCMTCHNTGGTAPHFAYGGTIALGKKWVVGTPAWVKTDAQVGDDNEYADEYGDYGEDEDDYGYCDEDDYGYSDEYGSYDEDDDYGYGDDDDDDYGGGCGRRGWPQDRTQPSTHTGVRIVGADGKVFDAVTDEDGNFWFKSIEDVAVPAFTGIQYGTFTVTGSTNGVACGSCHESGAADSPGRLWTWDGPTPR